VKTSPCGMTYLEKTCWSPFPCTNITNQDGSCLLLGLKYSSWPFDFCCELEVVYVFKLILFKISVIQGRLFTFQKSCPCKSGTPVHCKYREQGNGRSLWIWNSKTFSIWVSMCSACVNYGVNIASELLILVSLHC